MTEAYPSSSFFFNYWRDACERSVLFLDIMRRRGNDYLVQSARTAPHVLNFEAEVLVDGRTLPKPVNYVLVRIVPPADVMIDPNKRPFIVFDPRAGHGPGIGGMKHDSEIGVALRAGHPCYFVGFLPHPEPGQTIEDICRAEAHFVKAVTERHKDADGKPVLIGNCQAGWQIMMMAAQSPDLAGPILIAGTPLSYWAGVRGKYPMRYLGGMLGGTWLTSLTSDLGDGVFDGAWLISNFESNNPANTFWQKPYNVYANVDTEGPRYLEFEKWWGNPVLLNGEEIQFIVDELFVGNRLAAGEVVIDGKPIDLRKIKSPIIVFCSFGDDITPPQQALDWILDLYKDVDDVIASGQTILYSLHPSVGHLGIFVSGKVAKKEHEEFTFNMDLIDVMPPGLYEIVLKDVDPSAANPGLISGKYIAKLEPRTLDDIRALGCNDAADERRFETVARVSEVNKQLYRNFLQPVVNTLSTPATAEFLREMHPNRVMFRAFSDRNPLMQPIASAAEKIRGGPPPGRGEQSVPHVREDRLLLDHHQSGDLRQMARGDDGSDFPHRLWHALASGFRRLEAGDRRKAAATGARAATASTSPSRHVPRRADRGGAPRPALHAGRGRRRRAPVQRHPGASQPRAGRPACHPAATERDDARTGGALARRPRDGRRSNRENAPRRRGTARETAFDDP